MSSFLRLECKQKILSNAFWIRIFLLHSYSCGIETINTFIHSHSSLENHTRFQTKMGKVYTCSRPKTTKNSTQWGDTYLYGLYREVTPLGRYDRNSRFPMKEQAVCVTMRFKIAQLRIMMKSLSKVCIVWGKCKCGFLKEILCVIFTKIQWWILNLKNSFSKWIY